MGEQFEQRLPSEQVTNAVEGAAYFWLSHELGHALAHTLKLPITGREEDAADQFAAFVTLDGSEAGRNMAMAWTYLMADDEDQNRTSSLSDEHALNAQRRFNLLCWMYGQDPGRNAGFVATGALPLPRAERCPSEYAQLHRSWNQLLSNHLRQSDD